MATIRLRMRLVTASSISAHTFTHPYVTLWRLQRQKLAAEDLFTVHFICIHECLHVSPRVKIQGL